MTPLQVIEEALREAWEEGNAYGETVAARGLPKPPKKRDKAAPAVLSRVLAALGGEPPIAQVHDDAFPMGTIHWVATPMPIGSYLYEHPAPPIDLAAVRAVIQSLQRFDGTAEGHTYRRCQELSDRLLRAIGDVK